MTLDKTFTLVKRSALDCEKIATNVLGEYDITRVQASKLYLKKREEDNSWMAEYRNQTGQDVSFF